MSVRNQMDDNAIKVGCVHFKMILHLQLTVRIPTYVIQVKYQAKFKQADKAESPPPPPPPTHTHTHNRQPCTPEFFCLQPAAHTETHTIVTGMA